MADFATQSKRGFFLLVCCDHSNHGKWVLVFGEDAIRLSGALAPVIGLVLDRTIEFLLEGGIELSESSVRLVSSDEYLLVLVYPQTLLITAALSLLRVSSLS